MGIMPNKRSDVAPMAAPVHDLNARTAPKGLEKFAVAEISSACACLKLSPSKTVTQTITAAPPVRPQFFSNLACLHGLTVGGSVPHLGRYAVRHNNCANNNHNMQRRWWTLRLLQPRNVLWWSLLLPERSRGAS